MEYVQATTDTTLKSMHLRISGRVQGVWFRKNTLQQAQKRQLTGWVRNLDDGSVEAFVQGPADQVDDMILWCHQGSPLSRVDQVEASEQPLQSFTGFEIR